MNLLTKKLLIIIFITLLIVDIGLLIWLKTMSPLSPAESQLTKLQQKQENQKEKEGFVYQVGEEKPITLLPGYFHKNPEKGATAVGILESVAQEENEVVARFKFGRKKEALKIDFVIGLFEPRTKLHFYRSKTREFLPLSAQTRYQQIEPEKIVTVLQSYVGQVFRLSLEEPYPEEEVFRPAVAKEIQNLIRVLNPYFQCNKQLIEANKLEVLNYPVDCRGAVFNLLTYDPDW